MNENDMISSKDIITKTGISRATLNNYIKFGILPRPVVSSPKSGEQGVKQIGYFPADALERIYKVKLLKNQGMSMDDISMYFQDKMKRNATGDTLTGPDVNDAVVTGSAASDRVRKNDGGLQVTINDIQSPAYLVNRDFEVEWINSQAEDLVFKRNVRSLVDVELRNVFRLFLGQRNDEFSGNWRELAHLHFNVLQKCLNEQVLGSLYKGISETESALLLELFKGRKKQAGKEFCHIPVVLRCAGGAQKTFWVHTMTFREGTFFVFIPDDGINAELLGMLEHREKIINELLRRRMPSLVSLCVLIADLQDSVKISAELLPAQYFELINGLWELVGPSFERHNGIYGKHVGDGMLYYFIDKPGDNYINNCINCSIELREVMKEFSNKWKRVKGWGNDLYLNTGINEGQEFFGTIHSANIIEFTALGDTINIAARLSEFAHNGEIWTTKNLISKLTQEERNTYRFGVHQKNRQGDIFIRDSFSRVSDLISKEMPRYHRLEAIAGLPITEIRERITLPVFG